MTDDAEPDAEEDEGIWARSTAPQTPYTMGQVGTGIVIFAVGLIVTVGLPLLLG